MPDPWALLGIGRDADIGEIRRAYARKLKVTRPDEDPAAFQALVAARGAALDHAQRRADEAASMVGLRALDMATLTVEPGSATDEALDLGGGAVEHVGLAPDEALERAPRVHVELGLDRAPPVRPRPHVALELDEDEPSDPPAHIELPPDRAPPVRPRRHVALEPDDIRPPDAPAHVELPADEPDSSVLEAWPLVDEAELAAELQRLADTPPERPDIAAWRDLLNGLGHLPLAARQALEPALLRALGRILETAATRTRAPRWTEPIHWLGGEPLPDPDAFHRNAALLDLVCAFDDEFGWSTSDRAIYAAWSYLAAADQFKWHLSLALQARRARAGGLPSRRDGRGLPVIAPADAAPLLGAQADWLQRLLGRAHATGRWPASWSWRAFILAPLVALRYRHWGFAGLWLAAWVVLPAGATGLASILPEAWASLPFWLVGAAFLGLHAWFGAFGYRGLIWSGYRRLRAADRRFFSNREQRSAYLARTKQRRVRTAAERRLTFVIMLIVIIVIVLIRHIAGQ